MKTIACTYENKKVYVQFLQHVLKQLKLQKLELKKIVASFLEVETKTKWLNDKLIIQI
jgi:hypothetical protein